MTKLKAFDVILAPIITEKSTQVSEANQVIFKVAFAATKKDIKSAVEDLFKVKVKSVNTLVRKGKKKIFKGRVARLANTKKAVVTLESGHSIDMTTGL